MKENKCQLIYYCSVLIVFFACNSNKLNTSEQSELINIKLNKADEILVSTLFDSLTYIVLDDEKDISLLKTINKLEICDSLMFLLDKQNNKLHCFNLRGTYLNTIGNIGNGPGEYLKISDFAIDYKKNEIVVLDRNLRKILIYSFKGNFKENYTIKMMAECISVYNDGYFFYTSGSDYYTANKQDLGYNLFFTDNKCNIVDKMFKYNPECENRMKERAFDYNLNDSTLLFHYAIYDTIYKINKNGNITKYVVDFGNYKVPISKINSDNYKYYVNKDGYAIISGACHSDKYLFINYALNNRIRFLIANSEGECIVNASFMKNDIDKTSFALSYPLKMIDNRVYFIKNTSDLLFDHKMDSLFIDGKKLTLESNPVIIVGYLK